MGLIPNYNHDRGRRISYTHGAEIMIRVGTSTAKEMPLAAFINSVRGNLLTEDTLEQV